MKRIIKNPFTIKYPKIDLHGETTDTITYLINDFINDNIKLKNKNIEIIHGKGSGKLKTKTHELLKKNKKVNSYYMDIFNEGSTIVELNIDSLK